MKGASLRPDVVRPRPLRRPRHRARSATLWSTVLHHVWGQWRYEHDLADYDGPVDRRVAGAAGVAPRRRRGHRAARCCSSAAAGRTASWRRGCSRRPASPTPATPTPTPPTAAPSRSTPLIDGLLDHLAPTERLRHWVFDDLLDVPDRAARAGARRPVGDRRRDARLAVRRAPARARARAAPTSSSPTSAAPTSGTSCGTAPARRSTTSGASPWRRSGCSRDYVRRGARRRAVATRASSSRCTTCSSSGRSASRSTPCPPPTRATSPSRGASGAPSAPTCGSATRRSSPRRPTARPSATATCSTTPRTRSGSSRCSGWPTTRPFECIGQVDEARLAFELLRRRGVTGAAMRMYEERIGRVDAERLYADLMAVAPDHHAMPRDLADGGRPGPRATGDACRSRRLAMRRQMRPRPRTSM